MKAIHIEPKVEGRQMTRKQWKRAHREARILTNHLIPHAIPDMEARIVAGWKNLLLYGYGAVTHPTR